jgi:hypothetical protein
MLNYRTPERIADNFGYGLHALFDLLEFIGENPDEPITLDFTETKFTHPFLTAGISGLMDWIGRDLMFLEDSISQIYLKNYLSLVRFPFGIQFSFPYPKNLDQIFEPYGEQTYLPIINFPVDSSEESDMFRQKLMSSFESILIKQGELKGETVFALKYLVNELIDNMVNHSKTDSGKLFAQTFPTKRFVDICLLDIGRTLLDSYQEDERGRYPEIQNHLQAMDAAANGKSTKDMEISRGYGISTSRKMLSEGLKGNFFMLSGSAWFYQDFQNETSGNFNKKVFWPGFYAAIRIPLFEIPGFVHSKYLTH